MNRLKILDHNAHELLGNEDHETIKFCFEVIGYVAEVEKGAKAYVEGIIEAYEARINQLLMRE